MSEQPSALSDQPIEKRRMPLWAEIIGATALAVLIVITMGALAVYVVSGTDWGHERMRRVAQSFLQGKAHGTVRIGGVSGNLLTGMVVTDFSISDSSGAPFVAVSRVRGDYSIGDLLRRRIWVENVVLERPLIVLDKTPTHPWNWRQIFPRDTSSKPASAQNGWTDRLRFTNVSILDGSLVVRTPWQPSKGMSRAATDSAVGVALSGKSRMMIERVPDGFQKIIELKAVTGIAPLVRLSEPGFTSRLVQVTSMKADVYPFRPPAAQVTGFEGSLSFSDDSVWWRGVTVRMPGTVATGDGSYVLDSGDLTMRAHAQPVALADMRWLYPRMPSDAHGKLDFDLKWRSAVEDYLGYNMNIVAGNARLLGKFGLTRGDSVTFHDTDLQFRDVDTRLVEQLVEGLHSPRRGTLSGRAKVAGGRNALDVDADVTFADQTAGTSRVVALGQVGFPGKGIRARDLRLQLRPVQVELARGVAPNLPISGQVTGTATVSGNTADALQIVADLQQVDRGERSAFSGTGSIHLVGSKRIDVNATVKPLSLAEVGRFAPTVGLQGIANGPLTIRGTPGNLDVNADLRVSGGGRLVGHALVGVTGTKRYDITVQMYTLNAQAILAKAPRTSLTANAAVKGVGTDPATMHAAVAADLATSQWDSVAVDSASVRATIAGGLADIERLDLSGGHAVANVRGQFGLTHAATGTLSYAVFVDSLAAFNRWIPGLQNDSTVVPPRPGLVAHAIAVAKADSARVARATEIERIVTHRAPPTLHVTLPPSFRRDTVGGRINTSGTISGNLYDFDLRGSARGKDVAARGDYARRVRAEYAWANARTPKSQLVLALNADTVMASGFLLDSVDARVTYADSSGHVEVLVRQDDKRDYGLAGDFTLATARSSLRIADLRMRFDTALWSAPHPATIRWGGPGIQVDNLELRNRSNGRVYANGLLPTDSAANFTLSIENFPVLDVVDLLQSDLGLAGLVNVSGSMTGTLRQPLFHGAFGVTQGAYMGATLPELHGQFSYANDLLTTHLDALRSNGLAMATADGTIPINLAFSGVTGSRSIDAPLSFNISGDSLPIDLIPTFNTFLSEAHGQVAGNVSVRGRLSRPVVTGGLIIANTSLTVASSGMHVDNVHGEIRMANDVIAIGTETQPLAGDAHGPISLRGAINVGDWRAPSFDLYAYGTHAEVMNDKWGKLSADIGLALKGPFASPYLSGQVTITGGVIEAPEPTGRHVISAGDPALFNVIDTSLATEREVFPVTSPVLAHMRMEVTMDINRDTWVRNREANVEIYTDYPLRIEVQDQTLNLTGVLATDRGEYTFLSKRFTVTRGSAMFIGSQEINPTLQITGDYLVREGAGAATDVKIAIGGTLRRPRLSLESDAQPPRSQSELLSLLAFGQAATSLGSSQQTSSITTNYLLSQGAQVAGNQLAGVALGTWLGQAEQSFGKALAADYFNITPADAPTELLNGNNIGNFLTTTRFEGGKYVNPRTFVVGQMVGLDVPGARIQYRASEGWRYEASIDKEFLLKEPTLSSQTFVRRQSFGAFVIRQWKF